MAYLRKRYFDFLKGFPRRHFPGGHGISGGVLLVGLTFSALLVSSFATFTFCFFSLFYKFQSYDGKISLLQETYDLLKFKIIFFLSY